MQGTCQDVIAAIEAAGERHVIDYQGRPMVWRRFGSGEPLVLLHGGHGSWLHWIRNIQALARRRTVWVPDMPSYGDSAAMDGSGFEDMVGAMLAMLDDIFGRGTGIDLAGFSFGGMIAAHVAARRDGVRSLATLGSAGHGGMRREKAPLLNWKKSRTPDELEAAMRHNLAAQMFSDAAKIDDLAVAAHAWSCQHTRFRSKDIAPRGNLKGALAARDLPMLLIWGADDITADPQAILPALTQGHGNRTGRIIPAAGHWVQYECHAQINDILGAWLDRGS